MKLIHPLFQTQFVFDENHIHILSVEHPKTLVEMVIDIKEQIGGKENGLFVLSENGKIFDFSSNVSLITDIFNLEVNQKKILNKIQQVLLESAVSSEYFVRTTSLISGINAYLVALSDSFDYPLCFDDMDVQKIVKSASFKLTYDGSSLIQQIVEYIELMEGILGIRLFVFVNLRMFLDEFELQELYKCCFYKKIHIVLLEGRVNCAYAYEKIAVLDYDLCEILLK